MALLGQHPRKDEVTATPDTRPEASAERVGVRPPEPLRGVEDKPMTMTHGKLSESVLAAGLTVEGKIEGNGNVRVTGQLKGNVNVTGDVTIDAGASLDGEVKANAVVIVGDVRGHVASKSLVEFRDSGTLIGDLKAERVTVAAGSRMRGTVDFGWKKGDTAALPDGGARPVR